MAEMKVKIYGKTWCGDTRRALRFLDSNKVAYDWCDIEKDTSGQEFVRRCNNGNECVPTIVFPDGSLLIEPSDSDLARKLGLR